MLVAKAVPPLESAKNLYWLGAETPVAVMEMEPGPHRATLGAMGVAGKASTVAFMVAETDSQPALDFAFTLKTELVCNGAVVKLAGPVARTVPVLPSQMKVEFGNEEVAVSTKLPVPQRLGARLVVTVGKALTVMLTGTLALSQLAAVVLARER